MEISTVSFNQAKIYKDKMFFVLHNKDNAMTNILSKSGDFVVGRQSYFPQRIPNQNGFSILRKKEYTLPNNVVIFEFIERFYDKAGKLLDINKRIEKF